jgi:hypothetical protein
VILPVVAPLGTVAVIDVAVEVVIVATVPLNLTVGEEKFDPEIVTLDPTTPELGLKPLIVGPVPPLPCATAPVITKSFPAWKLFRYQVPPVPVAPQIAHRNVTVMEDERFCNALMLPKEIAV